MLFLYRPPQTWMPFRLRREPTQQQAYNRQLQERFAATRRVERPEPTSVTASPSSLRDPIADLRDLAQLHAGGALTDAEFAAAKAQVLSSDEQPS